MKKDIFEFVYNLLHIYILSVGLMCEPYIVHCDFIMRPKNATPLRFCVAHWGRETDAGLEKKSGHF